MSLRHDRIALLDRYTRIPTISRRVTPAMVDEVRAVWRGEGLELEPLLPESGAGTAALYGEIAGPAGSPVMLLYGHYDVQPTGDVDQWVWHSVKCPPFEPTYFVDAKQVDPVTLADGELDRVTMVARGGCDNKGQHIANILGALDAARAGTLQWTVKVILDGEEESGSPHLQEICVRHRDLLRADVLIGSDGPKQANQPTLTMGVRGLLGVDLYADNGKPASLHSGNYGNIVPNPVLPLARLVAEIEGRVREYAEAHDGFRQEAVQVFAEWSDRAVWKPFLWPTTNINHLMTDGASPELFRTIIPRTAHARIDVRLTPDTPPDAVWSIIEQAVESHTKETEGVTFRAVTSKNTPSSYTSPARPEFEWLLRLMREQGEGEPVAMPMVGGTLPNYVFTDVLGIPSFWMPAANTDNQQHDINEHYVLCHYFSQTRLYERIVSSRP
jgi:acetylornithine deacetylase/succinyl-diaminopimelate desuccinylase-like protein